VWAAPDQQRNHPGMALQRRSACSTAAIDRRRVSIGNLAPEAPERPAAAGESMHYQQAAQFAIHRDVARGVAMVTVTGDSDRRPWTWQAPPSYATRWPRSSGWATPGSSSTWLRCTSATPSASACWWSAAPATAPRRRPYRWHGGGVHEPARTQDLPPPDHPGLAVHHSHADAIAATPGRPAPGPQPVITRNRMTEHHDTEHRLLAQIGPAFPAMGWSARHLVQWACRLAEQDLADLNQDT
jgi:hypothetical protein